MDVDKRVAANMDATRRALKQDPSIGGTWAWASRSTNSGYGV